MTSVTAVAEPPPGIAPGLCASNLWERIDGWEVVTAVLLIVVGYSAVNILRMYFMVRIAQVTATKVIERHFNDKQSSGSGSHDGTQKT